jgi:hypothetical protein
VAGKLLSTRTEARLQRKLDEVEGIENGFADDTFQQTTIVRCTSAAAAAGSGVGAQCYPAIMLDPLPNSTTLPTSPTLATVWLTLLGPSGPIAPVSGTSYMVVVSGELTIGGVTRPRCFGVPGGLDLSSTACVRVVTWIACETGGLVQTFKWIRVPSSWVSDTAGEGCPTASVP